MMGWFTLINDTVEILDAPVVTDDYNSETRDWDNATVIATGKASVQPGFSDEFGLPDRQTTSATWRLISDDAALYVLEPTHRIRWQGQVLGVDSVALMWRWRGVDHHIEAHLRNVEG